MVNDYIVRYINELVEMASKEARRHRSDNVDAAHVERANAYLLAYSGPRRTRHLGTIGGIILGASFSNLFALVGGSAPSTTNVILTILFAVIGTALVSFHIAKD